MGIAYRSTTQEHLILGLIAQLTVQSIRVVLWPKWALI